MSRKYVLDGARLRCTMGATEGQLKVTSQRKVYIQGKLKATDYDKTVMPAFGACKACWPQAPCTPELDRWQNTSRGVTMGEKTFVMDDSVIACRKGGVITVAGHGQRASLSPGQWAQAHWLAELGPFMARSSSATQAGAGKAPGMKEASLRARRPAPAPADATYTPRSTLSYVGTGGRSRKPTDPAPEFRGHILFFNGYHSGGVTTANAITGQVTGVTDHPVVGQDAHHEAPGVPGRLEEDIYAAGQARRDLPLERRGVRRWVRQALDGWWNPSGTDVDLSSLIFPLLQQWLTESADLKKFYGYWNTAENYWEGSASLARYFNAWGNDHYINGSHGLGSPAPERLDHGVLLGYHWARRHWDVMSKDEVERAREAGLPQIEGFSPAWRPLTLVMHSQGNAPGVGAALGILARAEELGWEQAPLNLVLLGVHQPVAFTGQRFQAYEDYKVRAFGVDADTGWWSFARDVLGPRKPYMMKLASFYTQDKVRQPAGIEEWMGRIAPAQWAALKRRAVQFTFPNDRSDLVMNDGDIPGVASACSPAPQNGVLGFTLPDGNLGDDLPAPGWYPRSFNTRIEVDEADPDRVRTLEKTYTDVVQDFFGARRAYRQAKAEAEEATQAFRRLRGQERYYPYIHPWEHPPELRRAWAARNRALVREGHSREALIEAYAWVASVELEAHFAPVTMMFRPQILSDWEDYGGEEDTIWERISTTGKDLFYRVKVDKEETKPGMPPKYEDIDPVKYKDKVEELIASGPTVSTAGALKVLQAARERVERARQASLEKRAQAAAKSKQHWQQIMEQYRRHNP